MSDHEDPTTPGRRPTASDRAERDFAGGWGAQSQEAYDEAYSGGWGGPVHPETTGPMPKLRHRPEAAPEPADTTADDRAQAFEHDSFEAPAPTEGDADRQAPSQVAPVVLVGRPGGFKRRATTALAPITMWIVIGYLLVDYMRTIYVASTAAALGAPSDLGVVVVTIVAGLLKVVALACLARLALEACVHLAELAARR